MTRRALLCGLTLALVAACASGAWPAHEHASPAQQRARRVAQILEARHPSHAPLDRATAARALERLLHALDPASDCALTRDRLGLDTAGVITAIRDADFAFAQRAARACAARALTPEDAEALVLDALAAAYDPFCHYLDPERLARRRAAVHDSAENAAVAHGRMLERAGVRAGWIELSSFYLRRKRSASTDVVAIARELDGRGAQLLLLDLRGNGGGVVAEALALAGALLGGGVVAHERDAGGRVRTLHAPRSASPWRGPLVLLIDRGTASMAELFAAALQDRARALVVGERSHGKGLAQTLVLLGSPLERSEGAVEVSERAFYRLDGSVIQGRGITPDVQLALGEQSAARPAPFVAAWLPARIDPATAPVTAALPATQLARARAAASSHAGVSGAATDAADATDELERVLAVAIAYASTPAGGRR